MRHTDSIIAHAVFYRERFHFSVIPMLANKKPAIAWKPYQERLPEIREIIAWPHENLAIVTGEISGIVVVDCESREDAEWFWRKRGRTNAVVKTRRGFHLYYRHPGQPVRNAQHVENRYDVRGDHGYVMAPPSRHKDGFYKWVKPLLGREQLPVFRPEWRPETPADRYDRIVHDGEKYIANIHAVSGQRGHADTYRAACSLRESGLSEAEALAALQQWNKTNASPPWSNHELLHKIREAYR